LTDSLMNLSVGVIYTVSQDWRSFLYPRTPASNTPNSVCSSWISTKYCALH